MAENSVYHRAALWAATEDTGSSSLALLRTMLGAAKKTRISYPHDQYDIGRCFGLLKAVPEFRARLSEMKEVGPEWSALVDHWHELEAMHARKAHDPNIYKRMKAILEPIERTNQNRVSLGKNAAMYFGGDV